MTLHDWEGSLPEETNEEYHARDEYSSSNIKYAGESGTHYKHFVLDGNKKETDQLDFGSLAHEYVHEGKTEHIIAMPEFKPYEIEVPGKRPGTTKKHKVTIKAQQEEFLLENKDKTIVTQTQLEHLQGMKRVFDSDRVVQFLLHPSDKIEAGFRYWDEERQIKCRFRADRLSFSKGIIIDYKSCANASYFAFRSAIMRYGYHISAAHYMKGAERLFSGLIKKFIFIAQESKPPYAIGVYALPDIDLVMGKAERDQMITNIKRWEKDQYWPGYTETITPISLPDYSNTPMEEATDEAESFESISF